MKAADTGVFEMHAWDIDSGNLPVLNLISPTLALASDVIEHLHKPRKLLRFFEKLLLGKSVQAVVLSTPHRDAFYDPRYHSGPPHNVAHVREWIAKGFLCFTV